MFRNNREALKINPKHISSSTAICFEPLIAT
jgi:hypothetical protein